jgi:hypothetical protein
LNTDSFISSNLWFRLIFLTQIFIPNQLSNQILQLWFSSLSFFHFSIMLEASVFIYVHDIMLERWTDICIVFHFCTVHAFTSIPQ